jgi:hypothetical protein
MLKTDVWQSKPTAIEALWRQIPSLLFMIIELLCHTLKKEPIG